MDAPVTTDQLRHISELGQELVDKDYKIRELTDTLERLKENRKILAEQTLPEAMGQIRMMEFRLQNGRKVSIQPVIIVGYLKDKIDEVDDWLNENGHSGMVKNLITVEVPRGADKDNLAILFDYIKEHYGYKYEQKKSIHPQTIRAWGREMERQQMEIPDNIFTVYRSNIAIVE